MGKDIFEVDGGGTAAVPDGTLFGGAGAEEPRRKSALKTVLVTIALTVLSVLAVVGIASYFYWQHLKTQPQYSLALIVESARADDQKTIDELVDINAVVDDFLPQITGKAIELYGRGLAPETLQRVARIAEPVMPAVKERARDELPGAIRQKTDGFGNVPFAGMVVGADRYLDVRVEGENATVRSKLPEHNFEVRMQRAGERWKIVGVRDEELATRIAQRIGQEIVAIAVNGTGSNKSRLGVKNINELLRQAEEIFR